MVIHISEPGRPGNIPLTPPKRRKLPPVPDGPDASNEVGITPEDETYIAGGQAHRAVEAYGDQDDARPDDQDSYIPLSALTPDPLNPVDGDQSLSTALALMTRSETDHLTVVDDDNIVGIISRKWVFESLAEAGNKDRVLNLCTLPSFLYTTTESDARVLARRMLAGGHDAALIMDAQQVPLGLITLRSYLKHYAAQIHLDERL